MCIDWLSFVAASPKRSALPPPPYALKEPSRSKGAELVLQKVLSAQQRTLGPSDPATFETLVLMARVNNPQKC